MQKRRQINAEPGTERLRSSVAAATEPVRAAAHTLEEQVVWRGADWARDQADRGAEWARDTGERAREAGSRVRTRTESLRWPVERVTWLFERWVVWPIQQRVSIPRHALGAGALAALAIALVAFSVITLSGEEGPSERVVAAAPVSATTPAPAPVTEASPTEPVLRGAPPSFGVGAGVDIGDPAEATTGSIVTGTTSSTTSSLEDESAATSSTGEPVPAGPAAMKVARRFAQGFVLYEIGEKPERTAAIFDETTSTRLATALEERPPRQPEGVDVPQARVLNLVPGPRSGSSYTVSASLLRLGVTSELRLQLEKKNGDWLVTDVRG